MTINVTKINNDQFIKEFGEIPSGSKEELLDYILKIKERFWLYQSAREITHLFEITEIKHLKEDLSKSESERLKNTLEENTRLREENIFMRRKMNMISSFTEAVLEAENNTSLENLGVYPLVKYADDEEVIKRASKYKAINELLKNEDFVNSLNKLIENDLK